MASSFLSVAGSTLALLVISDAAAQIADPGHEAHLRNRRLVSARPWKHVVNLGYFSFRLLVGGVEFGAPM